MQTNATQKVALINRPKHIKTSCAGGRHNSPAPCKLTFELFDLESGFRVMCDVGYLCIVFSLPGLSVLDLGPMYATDKRKTASSLNAPLPIRARGIKNRLRERTDKA